MLTEHTWEQTGPKLYVLKAHNVNIVFADLVEAHEWAEERRLEAWTVTETQAWKRS